ncbi:hypothetical protein FRC10_005443, partial [Ceratobasidium sp. 414]
MSNNQVHLEATALPYFVARYEGRAVAMKRDASYQNIFISTTLTDYGDTTVQISEGIWPDLVHQLKTVEITVDLPANTNCTAPDLANGQTRSVAPAPPGENAGTISTAVSQGWIVEARGSTTPHHYIGDIVDMLLDPTPNPIIIIIMTPSQEQLRFDMLRPSTKIRTIKLLIESKYGHVAALQKLEFLQNALDDDKTLEESGVGDGASINLTLSTRQLAIYLPAPLPIDGSSERTAFNEVKVQLSLNRAWELAALRLPMEAAPRHYIQSGTWVVDITGNGSLLHRDSGRSFVCLLWDD